MKPQRSLICCLWIVFFAGAVSALEDPRLSITNASSEFIVFWTNSPGWVLEESASLEAPVPWTLVSPALYDGNAATSYVRIAMPEGNRFFRLRKIGLPIPGMSGYWPLEEGTGQVTEDGSGFRTTMLLTNGTWVAGRIGSQALQFNGGAMNAGGTRAWVTNSNYRVLPPSGQPFSISLWFSPDALTPGWEGIVGNDATGTNGWHVTLNNAGLGTNFLVFAATGIVTSLNITGRTLLLPGQWHQLTLTHNGTKGSLYLDSALLAEGVGSVLNHDGLIHFGGGIGNYQSFLGRIDDIRTYTNRLTLEQISLTGYWRFEEGAGNYSEDSNIQGHLAAVTDPMAWTSGHEGSGIDLAAAQAIIRNDHYSILPPSGGSFSISFWLRPSVLPGGWSGIMNCADGTNNGWRMAVESQGPTQTLLRFWATDTGGTLDLSSPVALTSGAWIKLDLTYNGGIANLYVNGRKTYACNGAIRGSRAPLVVGTVPGMTNFNGTIDDLKVYNRERDAAEIGPVAETMWETVFVNTTTNLLLRGAGPSGKSLTYSIVPLVSPTNGTVVNSAGSPVVTYASGASKGPDAFTYRVSDGEFTTPPAIVTLSVVRPHWLATNGGPAPPLDGSIPAKAWIAGTADAVDAIWKTNKYYDCFFYAPGEYQTRGFKGNERATANPGCKHIGAGFEGGNRTTLKLVDIWDSRNEENIFAPADGYSPCDNFEVHQMLLDCNAANLPKYVRGEPVWFRIPLAATTRVDTVTLRWADATPPWAGMWHLGRAFDFSLCVRGLATNTYVTNCVTFKSTGQVDVVTVGAETDELILTLNRRAAGVDFYGLAEVGVSGATVSLPSATIPGGGESQLSPQYSVMSMVDGDSGTAWASGPESQVEIVLPLDPGTSVSQMNLQWNCKTIAETGRLGPAASYQIRARDESTGQYLDVPFEHQPRTAEGRESATFGTNTIVTDQLVILLTERESGVDYYSLREVTLQNRSLPVAMRLPGALTVLGWIGTYAALRAFDRDLETQWASETQGMVAAINVSGNNLKFTHLKIIGFGTKAGKECFPLFSVLVNQTGRFGNVLVEDCTITEPATNNTDGVTALIVEPIAPASLTNAIVRRCTVAGLKPRFPTYTYTQGIGAVHVEDCIVENCQKGVYFEPVGELTKLEPVLIRSNRLLNVDLGVYLQMYPSAQFDSLTCLGNEIVLTGGPGWGIAACDTCSVGPSGSITNLTALNNIVRFADWMPRPNNSTRGLLYSDIHHAVFGNNIIALGTMSELWVRQCPAGLIPSPGSPGDCDHPAGPPGPFTYPPCVDILLPGYRRAWFNNRNLSGAMLPVRFYGFGIDGLASQQQWAE